MGTSSSRVPWTNHILKTLELKAGFISITHHVLHNPEAACNLKIENLGSDSLHGFFILFYFFSVYMELNSYEVKARFYFMF